LFGVQHDDNKGHFSNQRFVLYKDKYFLESSSFSFLAHAYALARSCGGKGVPPFAIPHLMIPTSVFFRIYKDCF
jgi:hypothetical protein